MFFNLGNFAARCCSLKLCPQVPQCHLLLLLLLLVPSASSPPLPESRRTKTLYIICTLEGNSTVPRAEIPFQYKRLEVGAGAHVLIGDAFRDGRW